MNVLVFPCGSEIGLEIHAALRACKDVRLHGASSVDDHGEFVYARYRRIQADSADAPALLAALNALIAEWDIDVVMPAHDSVIPLLAEAGPALRAQATVPPARIARICRDKHLTYNRLQHLGFVPRRVDGLADAYPIFAKPAVGQGSQGAERVDDAARHRQLLDSGIDYVFAEYLPGEEYTVDCISDADGRLLHAAPRRRERIRNGIAVRTAPAPADAALQAMAEAIADDLRLRGAWFFQARRDVHGVPKLLEVAPRIAGSMALTRQRGVNYPLLGLYAHLGRPFQVLAQDFPIDMDRALHSRFRSTLSYRRVYLDLDDTLLLRGRVNPTLMALLYQWRDDGKSIVLLTRHARCPRATLDAHHIHAALFEDIVHLTDGSPKSAAIDARGLEGGAIFIDDAFSERQDVHARHGMPVFDLDAIEQLLDGRA
ncbi:ATP-grasp domain-containing protein [Stenotrophomonas sp. HITSZ_GD]|uniref:ATP-grasp domain-containing protein n=1 Tax=Stenotrophomonas sp. HITSZ_GD TaxID=3037248 RepID=UPI00240D8370|nr:ATP-grasp domain-containing protein [Stenotrophomonas sp. HITSZ_GD]MDG2526528.1 ATP-grasp domain-containing protein [Stenotrophomonas sp. HITSZ_GD]